MSGFGLQVFGIDGTVVAGSDYDPVIVHQTEVIQIPAAGVTNSIGSTAADGQSGRLYYPIGNGKNVYMQVHHHTGFNDVISYSGRDVVVPLTQPVKVTTKSAQDPDYVYWENKPIVSDYTTNTEAKNFITTWKNRIKATKFYVILAVNTA